MHRIELKDDELKAVLARLSRSLTDMTAVNQDMGEFLVKSTKKRFTEGRDPDGNAWAPKSQTTLDAYRRRGDRVDLRPLFGPSGRLSNEIHHTADSDSLEWGSSEEYSGVQQFGARKGAFGSFQGSGFGGSSPTISLPWGDIPARPFLGLSEADKSGLRETVEEWLANVSKGGN